MNIIGRRKIYYLFSGATIIAGVLGVALFQFRLGIDFAGGTLWEIRWPEGGLGADELRNALTKYQLGDIQLQQGEDRSYTLRFREINENQHQDICQNLRSEIGPVEELKFETVGPTIGNTLRKKAIQGIIATLAAISLYIAWTFRKVSRPIGSWKYGLATVITLFHDVVVPLGLFAYLGKFSDVEIDSNFIVALLVVMGFSVHDTIVVFDRIRENLRKVPVVSGNAGAEEGGFAGVVNRSVNETLARSINTSLTTLLALAAVLTIGPASLKNFTLAVMTGILTGTYSSIFIASPLLVDWERWGSRKGKPR